MATPSNLFIVYFLFLGFALPLKPQTAEWILVDVQVVNVADGSLLQDRQDLLIKNGRIEEMGQAGTLNVDPQLIRVDAQGRYLIPGMWDMHAHPDDPEVWRMDPVSSQRDLLMPLFVLHGVTGIRDMAGSLALAHRWQRQGRQGKLLVPEIVACGPLLDGPDPMWDGSVGIRDSSQVPTVVDSLVAAGADFLKVYSLLPRDLYFALSSYALARKIPMVGHVPFEVLPSEAAKTGMKSQEHLLEILLECSGRREDIVSGNLDYGDNESRLDRYIFRQNLMMDTFDENLLQQLIQTFNDHGTWLTPTLSMWYKNAWFEQELEADDSLFSYLPPYLQKYWTPEHNDHLKHRDHPAFIELKRRLYEQYKMLTLAFHQGGVKLLAGTDMGANPLCFPGVGVHNELAALVDAGLSPAQALKTATINPAQFLEIDQDFGTIEPGKIADLVLLEANPLEDMRNLRNIRGVIKNGVLYDFQARSQKLKEIKQAHEN